jgi:hypothetical protein
MLHSFGNALHIAASASAPAVLWDQYTHDSQRTSQ